jgi:hypothetical protein
MKKIIAAFFLIVLTTNAYTKPLDEAITKKAGQNFLMYSSGVKAFKSGSNLNLVYKSVSDATGSNQVYFYVFNSANGFVIVSADDRTIPILGYSDEGIFDVSKMTLGLIKWLDGYKYQISAIVANNIQATTDISNSWADLLNPSPQSAPMQASTAVAPLTQTQWDQLPFYNEQCPFDKGRNRHAVTGCVATAMAQVMRYWSYPAFGLGFHSYNDNTYGTQSASFGGTTYQWSAMPVANIKSSNTAIASLMNHCGISVDMNYGVDESNANVISARTISKNCAEYALKTYFGYKASAIGILRSDYTDAKWLSAIKAELDAKRPVIYAGLGTGGGHCFVADGYDARNFIHFNWGWGGLYNGYFPINSLNPAGVGTGGGSGNYNDGQQAIIGIEPSNALINYSMALANKVQVSAPSVTYGTPFSVTANIKNNSTINFKGDICAAIFDNTNTLIDSIIIPGQSLAKGQSFSTDLKLDYPGSYTLLPGIYTIGIYYRPTGGGGNWSVVADNSPLINSVTLTIVWSNDLELDAPISVAPSQLVQGSTVAVNFNIKNKKATAFSGDIYGFLYNFDGTVAFTIQDTANVFIAGNSNIAGGLSLQNKILKVSPGTYLLVLFYKPNGGGFQIMGSTNFQNPIKVTVKAAVLPPDKYEPDNTVDSAYNFTPVFVSDSSHIKTNGSNCNTGADFDYYKINLPAGYYYNMRAHIDDATYNTNGLFYSLEGVLSYSEDGKNWSETYDNNIPYDLIINGPGFIYFKVAPYFAGQTGTYLLETKMKRFSGAGIQNIPEYADKVHIYPNPATNVLNIDLSGIVGHVEKMAILAMDGKTVFTEEHITGNLYAVPVNSLAVGLYMVQIKTDNGIINKKISIVK